MTDSTPIRESVEVAIVGGGPAGAALAIHLARRGIEVAVLERARRYRWRACGVFSPTAENHIAALGLDARDPCLVRPLSGLRLEVPGAPPVALFDAAAGRPVGLDRAVLDLALLDSARSAGADVRTASEVTDVSFDVRAGRAQLRLRERGEPRQLAARLVVGADGVRSIVARAAGVRARTPLRDRIGLTFHVAEAAGEPAMAMAAAARMIVFDGGYCGLCPVPGGRLNVGIVLHGRRRRAALRTRGASFVASSVLAATLPGGMLAGSQGVDVPLDRIAGASPLAHLVERTAGPGWLLVGDATGFTDPFTGEGLGRAFVSAALAGDAIGEWSRGDRDALETYAARTTELFERRDRLSLLLQSFVARPALLAYAIRRLAGRAAVHRTLELVLADRLPPERVLAPRFLAALLAP